MTTTTTLSSLSIPIGQAFLDAQGNTIVAYLQGRSAAGELTETNPVTPVVGTTANTFAAGNDPRIVGALQKANNLSDILSVSTALSNLGGMPLLANGSIPGHSVTVGPNNTVIDGGPAVAALAQANNLSDLTNPTTALNNLGAIPLIVNPTTGNLPLITAQGKLINGPNPSSLGGGAVTYGATISTAAQGNDPRFPTVDLGLEYGAPLDGTSHLLTQTAALAAYPECGAPSGGMEHDAAAFTQAEYVLRNQTSGVGVISIGDGKTLYAGATQLYLQNGSKVWLEGGRDAKIIAPKGIKVANATNLSRVLYNFNLFAQTASVSPSTTGNGTVWTGYTTGATALEFENCQGIEISRVGWNGYDQSIVWDNNSYGIVFNTCGGGGNNWGFSYIVVAGASNAMERIIFVNGSLSNNNFGFYIDATVGNTGSQGGSFFFAFNSIDYNVVRQGYYLGSWKAAPDSVCLNSVHLHDNHIETEGACSGSSLCRIYSKGTITVSFNDLNENDGNTPLGFVEVADNTSCTMLANRLNSNTMALMWSGTTGYKRWFEAGNTSQEQTTRLPSMIDANGTRYQQASTDGGVCPPLFNDPNPLSALSYYGYKFFVLDYFGGPGNFTLPTTDFAVHDSFNVRNMGANPITIAVVSGGTLALWPPAYGDAPAWNGVLLPGQDCFCTKTTTTQWDVIGPQQQQTLNNYANDAAAATGGVAVGGLYRTGNAVQVRLA